MNAPADLSDAMLETARAEIMDRIASGQTIGRLDLASLLDGEDDSDHFAFLADIAKLLLTDSGSLAYARDQYLARLAKHIPEDLIEVRASEVE